MAHAYIPSAGYILNMMGEKRTHVRFDEVTLYLKSTYPDQAKTEYDEKLYMKRGGKLRWVRTSQQGDTVTILRDGTLTELSPDGTRRVESPSHEPLVDFLLPRHSTSESMRHELLQLCQKLNIESGKTFLSRFNSRVAYVIGGKINEKNTSQLWIDKDGLWPVRIVYEGSWQGKRGWIDLQFRDFASPQTQEYMPRVIERYVNGVLVWHAEVKNMDTTSRLAERLFQPSVTSAR